MEHIILENGEYAMGVFIPSGATVIDSAPPTKAHKWEDNKWVFKGFTQEAVDNKFRFERNFLLAETDWWANSDLTMTQEQKNYRKALRDLPSTASPELDENGQLTGVTWPTKPE